MPIFKYKQHCIPLRIISYYPLNDLKILIVIVEDHFTTFTTEFYQIEVANTSGGFLIFLPYMKAFICINSNPGSYPTTYPYV